MKRFQNKRRKAILVVTLLLAVLMLPYLYSRIVSGGSRVKTFIVSDVESGEYSGGPLRVACYNIAHGRGLAKSNWDGAMQRRV